ncbi:MAG TPA: Fic family protein [Egibacteraceae bacterium]|nr:Fic family protein [Egibacteraceae bacterium]
MRIAYSDHLVALLCQGEAAAARLAGADPDRRAATVAAARRESALLSARLDASPLEPSTAEAVDARDAAGLPPLEDLPPPPPQERARAGSWARALKLEDLPTQDVAALEYANLLTTFDAEPGIAGWFFERPLDALAELHRLLTHGLVAPEDAGRPRRTEQAVHDGAQGKVIYNTPAPEAVPGLLEELAGWLTGAGGRLGSAALPGVLVAGVVHERLLEWQPFEAANGRLARCAARVVLRARGVDPHGCAVVERELARDVAAYHREVAATMRRRDLGPWLERWAEAALVALEDAADAVDPRPRPEPPARARELLDELRPDEPLTIADYARRAGVTFASARADLHALVAAGGLRRDLGSRGLRFRRI